MCAQQPKKKIAWSLWIPVILAFVLVITAWTILIKIAKDNPVELIDVKTNVEHRTSTIEP